MFKVENFYERIISGMEEAYTLSAGVPHVIEGNRGIYEYKLQPVTPLISKYKGFIMNENVYALTNQATKSNPNQNP